MRRVYKENEWGKVSKRIITPPQSYNPDQRAFIEMKVNKMLEASIICPIHP